MKLFQIDHFINTFLVFFVMLVFPLLSEFEFFQPFFVHLKNFELTDIKYKDIGGKDIGDSKIILIKSNNLDLNQVESLINKLNSGNTKPKVIGIESIYNNYPDTLFEGFNKTLSQYNNIVLADSLSEYNHDSGEFKSIVSTTGAESVGVPSGYKNLLIDLNKEFYTVREYFPFFIYMGKEIESFSAQIVKKYNADSYEILKSRNNETETINYKGGGFSELDYQTIMADDHKVNFNDKIVLIGKYEQESENTPCIVSDLYFTPMNDRYSGKSYPDMYGIEIQANIISMVLDKEYYTLIPRFFNYLVAAFFVYMNMVVFTYITVKNKKLYELMNLLIFVAESLTILYISGLLYHGSKIEIDFTPTLLALILSIFAFEGYNESLKPLAIKFYYKFLKRGDL